MAGLQGAVESAAPVSRLHEHHSADLADFPVPSGREEEWRFTPLRRLRGLQGAQPLEAGKVTVEIDAAPEVSVERPKRGDARFGTAFMPADRVSARAFASFDEGTVVGIPADTDVSEPTVVTVRGHDAGGASFGHTLIDVGRHSRAVVVLDHAGSATYADNVEFVVGDGASLSVVSVQDWAADAVHLSQHQARVGRDATFQHTVVTLGGGDPARISHGPAGVGAGNPGPHRPAHPGERPGHRGRAEHQAEPDPRRGPAAPGQPPRRRDDRNPHGPPSGQPRTGPPGQAVRDHGRGPERVRARLRRPGHQRAALPGRGGRAGRGRRVRPAAGC